MADSIGPTLFGVLDVLGPAESLAFVLHDMFAVPFEEIAAILGRSPTAVRQLASRARRCVQGAEIGSDLDQARQPEVVEAFLTASREGDFEALLSLTDPDVVLRSDRAAADLGAPAEIRGPVAAVENFKGRARGARLALMYGRGGAVWVPGERPDVAFDSVIWDCKIAEIAILADPAFIAQIDLVPQGY